MIFKIALDRPLRRVFDYRAPQASPQPATQRATDGAGDAANAAAVAALPPLGVRIKVPFGRRQLIGILVGIAHESTVSDDRLKTALAVLDTQPVFDPVTFELLRWAADYYHHPLGEVLAAALPGALRSGQPATTVRELWSINDAGRRERVTQRDRRAPQRRALLEWLATQGPVSVADLPAPLNGTHLKALVARGWVEPSHAVVPRAADLEVHPSDVTLTAAQATVVDAVIASVGGFAAHLLHGVTGSGKTEVYLRSIAAALGGNPAVQGAGGGTAKGGGGQVLVLVPEIALTPQLVERFRQRFSGGIVVLHSALTDAERRTAWRAAHAGEARIVIGTRSAVFTSLPQLAMIVVDEEHDPSYKQQEGFRYSARDLAVWRARRAGVPVILGSATPSLETLDNAAQDRYRLLSLPQRPGAARPPQVGLVDLRRHAVEQGLSQPALQAIGRHLGAGGQILVFLNRRGYAPALFCNACGWVAACAHCDARMTLHRQAAELRCHHCGAIAPIPSSCGNCAQPLHPIGQGTERVEETLQRLFPAAPLARMDRDTATKRGELEALLQRVHRGEARILIGTQMLTKGHHFPDVSLVVILDADQGLFASDFRATERLAQTITQVAGRAGRAARPGEVLIQTAYPEHPLLTRLIESGYDGFARSALDERRQADWPPYSRLALLRAEARDNPGLIAFLRAAAAVGTAGVATAGTASAGSATGAPAVKILGPAPALMARRADHYRAHLLLEAATRAPLQRFLTGWLPRLEELSGPPGLRWSIDVDPLEID